MDFFAQIFCKAFSPLKVSAKMTKVMEESTLNRREWAVKDLPFPVLNMICVKLNILNEFFKDFRMVADKLGTDRDVIEWIGQSENPTYKIFSSCHRGAKVGRLIEILHEIERPEVAKLLEDWHNLFQRKNKSGAMRCFPALSLKGIYIFLRVGIVELKHKGTEARRTSTAARTSSEL